MKTKAKKDDAENQPSPKKKKRKIERRRLKLKVKKIKRKRIPVSEYRNNPTIQVSFLINAAYLADLLSKAVGRQVSLLDHHFDKEVVDEMLKDIEKYLKYSMDNMFKFPIGSNMLQKHVAKFHRKGKSELPSHLAIAQIEKERSDVRKKSNNETKRSKK